MPREVKVLVEDLGKCKYCRGQVAWITSKRTNKKYPVNYDEQSYDDIAGHWFVMADQVHKCKEREEAMERQAVRVSFSE